VNEKREPQKKMRLLFRPDRRLKKNRKEVSAILKICRVVDFIEVVFF